MASRPSIKYLINGRSVRPPCDDVMTFCDVIVIFLLTELTTQLSKSMLNTKSDIFNLKMQKMSKTLINVASSFSCDAIQLILFFKNLQERPHVRKNLNLLNAPNRFYDKILSLDHPKNVTP